MNGNKSITTVSDTWPIKLNSQNSLRLYIGGTYVGLNLSFEGSLDSTNGIDGNWMPITGVKSTDDVTQLTATGVIASPQLSSWLFNISGYTYFRSKITAITSGAANLFAEVCNGDSGIIAVKTATFAVTQSGTFSVTQSGVFTTTPVSPTTLLFVSAATTNAISIKASAGNLFSATFTNYSAADKFVKFYNKASAPTVGTDVPTLTFKIPANSDKSILFGALGTRFSTGIAMAVTNLVADTDTTVIAVKDVKGHIDYN